MLNYKLCGRVVAFWSWETGSNLNRVDLKDDFLNTISLDRWASSLGPDRKSLKDTSADKLSREEAAIISLQKSIWHNRPKPDYHICDNEMVGGVVETKCRRNSQLLQIMVPTPIKPKRLRLMWCVWQNSQYKPPELLVMKKKCLPASHKDSVSYANDSFPSQQLKF